MGLPQQLRQPLLIWKNPALDGRIFYVVLAGFIGTSAEAAKFCFRGVFAAFDLGEFHRVFGRGSKNLLLEACLLPLILVSFIRSLAEAAKSGFAFTDTCGTIGVRL